ncbi:DUF4373 domain-containing protein [Sporomusa sphaeroides]|uniref:DUF4373 domain-containing protein n=1 Tax=Sporomusa sphaeroides TaxID=47679 RepID=UPI003DA1B245
MARPIKDIVDYFPHSCNHGKTMFIIEQHYGNDGYAFWFKLLELLGKSEGHYINCNNIDEWEFLQATTRFLEVKCREILNKLALLGAIDKELWEERQIIWSDNFIKNIADAYKNRKRPVPTKPFQQVETPTDNNTDVVSTGKTLVSTESNPQKKREEKRINNNKPIACAREDGLDGQFVDNLYPSDGEGNAAEETAVTLVDGGQSLELSAEFERFWQAYPRKNGKSRAVEAWKTVLAEGYRAIDLALAAGKYSVKVRTEGIVEQYIKMPHTFLAERLFVKYLPPCPKCGGSGFFGNKDGEVEPCECKKAGKTA